MRSCTRFRALRDAFLPELATKMGQVADAVKCPHDRGAVRPYYPYCLNSLDFLALPFQSNIV